ncbi:MAG: hypothetical protein J7M19_03520, partial [Planctomycetes bacterium]|nr:hypothetical protein [Planctomycetota bacterium]
RRPAHSIVEKPTFFLKHWWHSFLRWSKEYKDQALTGAVAILVILMAGFLWQRHRRSTDLDAWGRLGLAQSLPELEAAVFSFGSTSAANPLKLKLAATYFSVGSFDKAESTYFELTSSREPDISLPAAYGLANALESRGDFDKASKTLEALAARGGFWGQAAQEQMETQPKRKAAYERLSALREEARKAAEAKKAEAPEPEGQESGGAMEAAPGDSGDIPATPVIDEHGAAGGAQDK